MAEGRREELLELSYAYVQANGLADLSLRPLAAAGGSSPRVLLFLFGSKDGLVRALLARARREELALLAEIRKGSPEARDESAEIRKDGAETRDGGADLREDGLAAAGEAVWGWLCDDRRRPLLRLWVEAYARSLIDHDGPWAGYAAATVADWLEVLARAQPAADRDTPEGLARRTAVLAVLRGALLDLLATGDTERTTAAVRAAMLR